MFATDINRHVLHCFALLWSHLLSIRSCNSHSYIYCPWSKQFRACKINRDEPDIDIAGFVSPVLFTDAQTTTTYI